MTIFIADIASYQGGISLADLRHAGFTAINVKISHGITRKSVHPNVAMYVQQARAAGMEVGTFHWLDGSASGQEQAAYAYSQMQQLPGGARGLAHTVDTEDVHNPATPAIWADYVGTMTRLLGRPIATYSGDWWWERHMAGVPATIASPWLWSAPREGYPGRYMGDTDEAAWAGYGPWPSLSVQQYAVAPVDGIRVSMSAVRSEGVWAAMRGEGMGWENVPASISLLDEFNEAFPNRDKGTDGTKGDDAHAQRSSDHNPDETGRTPYEDQDSKNEVHARDIGDDLNRPGWTMRRCIDIIVDRHRRGLDDRLQNIIHHGKVISRTWGWSEWRDSSGHETWAHFGFRYGSGGAAANPEERTGPWGILAAIEAEKNIQEEDMTKEDIAAGVLHFFGEAARAARGEAGGDSSADKWARGARVTVNDLFDFSAAAPRAEAAGGDATMRGIDALNARLDEVVNRLDTVIGQPTPPTTGAGGHTVVR